MMYLRIGDIVAHNARRSPDAAALIEGDRVLGWRDVDRSTNRIVNALASNGFGKGKRVATIVRNGAAAVEWIFALAKGGVLAVPVNYGLTPNEIAVLLDDSRPDAIVVDAEFLPTLESVLTRRGVPVIVRGDVTPREGWLSEHVLLANASELAPDAGVDPDDIRTIRYTSGTTAAPKGCLGTHRQILSSIDNFLRQIPVPERGPFLQMLPLFSGAGIWMAIAAAFHGLANVLMPEFSPRVALEAIAKHGVVHTCGVPTMLSRLTEELQKGGYVIDSLRLFGYTGSKMPPATIARALQTFACDFYQGFGGGEMGGLVSYLMPEDHRAVLEGDADADAKRLASVGRPAGYAEICIRDLKSGVPLPANEPGEITVRSASNFSGYLNRPEDTAKTLRGEWVYTGDVGYLDNDGYLFAIDRAKDMVVTGGMNVSSAEVEAVLAEHPAVKSVAVIGLPSEEWGEAVTAVVVLREGGASTPTELMQFARARLAGYKSPKAVHFVGEFPLNSVGKVLKRELRDQFTTPAAAQSNI
ncbi:AMP-binding protein [Paraburkholderia nodosa]|uniref:AMP-binding protein n=1 Tax=Paraburkholderia nodosa TaxID=392320 RepID=UPI0004B5E14F|nr:AMP-binding protein [Paraburkholderia nodosa]